jgi:hypothetical protein
MKNQKSGVVDQFASLSDDQLREAADAILAAADKKKAKMKARNVEKRERNKAILEAARARGLAV